MTIKMTWPAIISSFVLILLFFGFPIRTACEGEKAIRITMDVSSLTILLASMVAG